MEQAMLEIHLSPSSIELCSVLLKESKIFVRLCLTLAQILDLLEFELAAEGGQEELLN